MNEMMQQCCGSDGMPNFEMMKQFMEKCGKEDFSEQDMEKMKQFCCGDTMPDMSEMMKMMESCGCHVPESEAKEQRDEHTATDI